MARITAPLFLLVCAFTAGAAGAAEVQHFSPQGAVKDVRQVSARFSDAMVRFGDPRLPDPFDVECAAAGKGRWADARNWVYDFAVDLPAGESCSFTLKEGVKALDGEELQGQRKFSFGTGGPAIRASMPYEGSTAVDEAQVFLLGLDAPATKASVEAHAYCAVANLAERLPLQVLEGQEREALLAQRRLLGYAYYRILWKDGEESYAQVKHDQLAKLEANVVVARCARPLPAATEFDLVWGAGIATASGLQTTQDQVIRYQTRPAFSARFECDRVNAEAPCVPVLPMRLYFTAPVPAELAGRIRLHGDGASRAPAAPEEDTPMVDRLEWAPPFPEAAQFKIELPAELRDDAGRALANAGSFPLAVATDEAPPLAKFNAEFGILELEEGGILPVTLRDLEDPLQALKIGGAAKRIDDEAEVLRWMALVRQRMRGRWEGDRYLQPGRSSVFEGEAGAESFSIARPEGAQAFEVVGIPLKQPGFHVVELASPRLGAALLGEALPRYVAATALVTDLAVHFKWGRQGSLVFVTRLSDGKPVSGAQLRIVDGCDATPVWSGATGDDGIARIDSGLRKPDSWSSCDSDAHPLMISARKDGDFSFALSSWNDGIAPMDFNLEMGLWTEPGIAHAVLDRSLFRAGETASMKHYWREHTAAGLVVPQNKPGKLVIQHLGSDQSIELPLSFDAQGIAETQWPIPKEARLGEYSLRYEGTDISQHAGSLRVEQYRVPLMRAQIQPPAEPAVAARELPLDLFVGYFSGGGAAGLPVKLRTQVQPRSLQFDGYEAFSFGGEPVQEGVTENQGGGYFPEAGEQDRTPRPSQTLPLSLDTNGSARATVPELPLLPQAQTLIAELEYPDANGELSSARTQIPLWPAAVVVGLSTEGWAASKGQLRFKAVVLDVHGKPVRNRAVKVRLYQSRTHSYRKRLVGGFYAYSHSSEVRALDASCSERSNAQGLVLCEVAPEADGEILLEATVQDDAGRTARAVTSAWVAGADDWWFAQGDSDRMDLVPERREIEPGETLRLQVRMPFRKATALVTVEREGVIESFVTELSGREPVVEVPMLERYAPNVFVSVLALRPRVSDFRSRFYDFLRLLGLDRWFRLDGGSPTAMTDLSKPAYRLGMAAVDVGWSGHRLQVQVKPQQETFKTRGTASVQVQVTPAAGGALPADAEIAFSAVDEALLDLLPNTSVDLLQAMMQRRGIEVVTSTAQMQVVGKRHYGRKAMAPGGGGGRGAARELLDPLLLWKGRVPLDAQGRASIEVPLNDALSSFRLTAVASAGADRFGEGHASIRTTQDVQLLSGLPPLVREGDRYEAVFTVRNTTAQPLRLEVDAEITADGAATPGKQTQAIDVPAQGAAPARFVLTAPFDARRLSWSVTVETGKGETLDALKVAQEVVPAYPVRVYQATLLQLQGPVEMPVAPPADRIAGRGGLRVNLQPSLTASLDTVREYMALYPYGCYEQIASKAVALRDAELWKLHMSRLSAYLDGDGLLKYFPSNWLEGSDTLTAYVLAIAHEAGWEIPGNEREQMLGGLEAYASGRITRGNRLALADQTERKLAAIEALSRYGRADAAWLSSITIDPNLWHTSAVIDWIGILQRVADLPRRDQRLAEAQTLLRSRLNFQGTTMGFSAEQDDALWWLMVSADVNANRALLALLQEPGWREDLPRMLRGAVGRQQRGHWNLTTANAWGVLALEKFAAAFEREPVGGSTSATLGTQQRSHAWKSGDAGATLDLLWTDDAAPPLKLDHAGSGAPWATVQSRAAIPLREPFSSGYRIERKITPVEQKVAGSWTRGDTARISLSIDAQSDMTWVVVEDPVPAGATILGGGLGRDSQLLAQGERREGDAWPAFEERRFDFYRAYYEFVPKGRFTVEYTVRYNNAGRFEMPATRVEAMYSPEMLGEVPNAVMEVGGS